MFLNARRDSPPAIGRIGALATAPHRRRYGSADNERDGNDRPARRFLILCDTPSTEPEDLWEICQTVAQLGGVETKDGYEFANQQQRDEAADVLAAGWGGKYFRIADARRD